MVGPLGHSGLSSLSKAQSDNASGRCTGTPWMAQKMLIKYELLRLELFTMLGNGMRSCLSQDGPGTPARQF